MYRSTREGKLKTISVTIPALDEEQSVAKVVEALSRHGSVLSPRGSKGEGEAD